MPLSNAFQFKQFTVKQDQCAMKVSLDACLFGAVCEAESAQSILDIGTGTGLLALMLAQRTQANIQAVELDIGAANQAKQNVANSPFHQQISVHNESIQNYCTHHPSHEFDLIICNPPFFSDHLKGSNAKRNLARHNEGLSFTDLIACMMQCLSNKGSAWILLPQHEHTNFHPLAIEYGLHLQKWIDIYPRKNKASKLGIWVYGKQPREAKKTSITIYSDNNEYTNTFSKLLASYYLKL